MLSRREIIPKNGHLSILEKDYNDVKLQYNKQSVEEKVIQRAVKTTIQILYDKGIFNHFNNGNAFEILEDVLFFEKHRPDLEKVNDVIQ